MARRPVNSPYTITTEFGVPDSYAKFGRHSEEWKPVKGYENLYLISSLGRLSRLPVSGRTRNSKNPSFPNGSLNTKGYRVYKLYSLNGSKKTFTAHKLVAEAFIPNPNSLPQVNHINGNKLDNSITNLEWITNQDNMAHALKLGLVDNRGEKSGVNKFSEKLIRQILESPKGKKYRILSEETGISIGYIKAIRRGKRWNHLWSEYNA